MEPGFNLTIMEVIFLVAAVLVTLPMVLFIKWVLAELKKEHKQAP